MPSNSVPISARFKALETDDHDARHTVDLKSLRSLNELLALVAVPLVIFVKSFRLFELLQALVKLNLLRGGLVFFLRFGLG